MRATGEIARCGWCNRRDVPVAEMAVYSWKHYFGMFTGVCKACILDEQAEARYYARASAKFGELERRNDE